MTCGKSGWCLSNQCVDCIRQWWAWDEIRHCTCHCHQDTA